MLRETSVLLSHTNVALRSLLMSSLTEDGSLLRDSEISRPLLYFAPKVFAWRRRRRPLRLAGTTVAAVAAPGEFFFLFFLLHHLHSPPPPFQEPIFVARQRASESVRCLEHICLEPPRPRVRRRRTCVLAQLAKESDSRLGPAPKGLMVTSAVDCSFGNQRSSYYLLHAEMHVLRA